MNFDEEIAKELGVECAIVYSNLLFWVKKNKANKEERHFHEDKWWTYNNAGSFKELFPWWSERNIYRFLKKLEDAGYVQSGNFNKFKYDRTKWYTTDTEKSLIKPIRQKRQMDSTKVVNGFANLADGITISGGPIPDINTDNKHTDINTYINSEQVADTQTTQTNSNWTSIVLYFYSKVSPSTEPKSRFRNTTKPSAIHLLSLHSEETIRLKIDALAANQRNRQFITRFEIFCNKFDSLPSKSAPVITTTYIGSKQSIPSEPSVYEPEPNF